MSEELSTAVDEAMAPTVGRLYAESLRVANDETVQRLAQRGIQIGRGDILHLHLAVLLDTLLGDFDDERRQAYEVTVHTRLAELLAEVESQAARSTLLQGVTAADPSKLPNPFPNGPRSGRRR